MDTGNKRRDQQCVQQGYQQKGQADKINQETIEGRLNGEPFAGPLMTLAMQSLRTRSTVRGSTRPHLRVGSEGQAAMGHPGGPHRRTGPADKQMLVGVVTSRDDTMTRPSSGRAGKQWTRTREGADGARPGTGEGANSVRPRRLG